MLDLIGRFHPLVLHLPIGILSMAYLLEGYMTIRKVDYKEVQSFILLIAALTATLSVITGLMLVRGGDYAGGLVFNHKWAAIALSVVCWALFLLSRRNERTPYYIGMVSSMLLLGITGHLGGSITHGEDFLTKSSGLVVRPSLEDAEVYYDIIEPIFDSKCYSCHNTSKLKGELDMTTIEGLKKGGENGQVLFSEDTLQSKILKRIHLPLSAEEHMPPENKKQLTEDEVRLIEWWISKGADFDAKAMEVDEYGAYKDLLIKFLEPPKTDVFTYVPKADSSYISRLRSNGMKLYAISAESSAVYVNFLNKKDLKNRDFSQLRKIKNNIAHINLSGSSITDDMMGRLNRFKHLEKLELQNTEITSKGLNKLKEFQFLKTLNLYNTSIDSSAVQKILSLPQLRSVFLWKTDLTERQIAAMRLERPRLNVNYALESDKFDDAALKPPLIVADQDIFSDSMEVALNLNFNGAEILYTLNSGDTLKYEKPFQIHKTTKVTALARKEGWLPSPTIDRTFVKSGKKIQEIALLNQPHERYADAASKVLINNKLGSSSFNDGQWVGYEGEHAGITIGFEQVAEIEEVNIGALELTGSYIFYPKGIRIEVSKDGKNFKEVASQSYEMVSEPSSAGRKMFNLSFESEEAKWLRLEILGHLKNPEWHVAPGAKNWIFIDEILVN